jgi:hypothetical protein
MNTTGVRISDAEICRSRGWKVGTVLIGDEGFGPDRILITAIGEQNILARKTHKDGVPVDETEHSWTLQFRDWCEVSTPNL